MSIQLLDKIRKVNRLLHNSPGYKISVEDMCDTLGSLLVSNVLIIDEQGRIVGAYEDSSVPVLDDLCLYDKGKVIDKDLNSKFNSVLSAKDNIELGMFSFEDSMLDSYVAALFPVIVAGERLGTVFIYRLKKQYDIDDIILGEHVTSIVSMELMHDMYNEDVDDDQRELSVRSAVKSLSASELFAANCVFTEMNSQDEIVITSHIASKYNITRSAIINAIKKLNSAGVIESKSLGVKGTRISVENDFIVEAIAKMVI